MFIGSFIEWYHEVTVVLLSKFRYFIKGKLLVSIGMGMFSVFKSTLLISLFIRSLLILDDWLYQYVFYDLRKCGILF